MKYQGLLVNFVISYFYFALSKDIIGSEGIPNHWKRYHEPVNNPNYNKPQYFPNKILDHKLNYQNHLQDFNKIVSPKYTQNVLQPFYKIRRPTFYNEHKKLPSNLNDDLGNIASSNSNRDEDRQVDENDKSAGNDNRKMEEEDTRAMEQVVENTNKDGNIKNSHKSDRRGSSDERPMKILHQHRKIPLRQTRQMDPVNNPERMFDDKSFEQPAKEEFQNTKLIKKRSDSENDENVLEENDKNHESRNVNEYYDDKDEIVDRRRAGNMENDQTIYLNQLHNRRGWIRYRFMANQFNLPNRNYISKLNPYTNTITPYISYKLDVEGI